jgi:4-oxalocrotonate tautomerase
MACRGRPCRSLASPCPRASRRSSAAQFRKGSHSALVETFGVPEQDLFQIITQHDADNPIEHAPSYLGIAYSDDLTIIQLTVSDTRSLEQKRRLFARIAERLAQKPGLRPDDIFINLVEVKAENWSFGRGEAQYASGAAAR